MLLRRRRWQAAVVAALLLAPSASAQEPSQDQSPSDLTLWYRQPAKEWVEAAPIGAGGLGAMIYGGVDEEHLQFNEDTVWKGRPHDYAHKGAAEYLPEIRELLWAGKQRQAEGLASREFMSVPLHQKAYQPLGDLKIRFPGEGEAENYRRELDLDTALANVAYTRDGVRYTREYFASYPDQAIVCRLTCDKPGGLAFTARLSSPHDDASVSHDDESDSLVLSGQVERDGVRFESRLRVRVDQGDIRLTDDGVSVSGANEATLLLVGASSVVNYQDISADPAERCREALAALDGKDYESLRTRHVDDYQELFHRVAIDLGRTDSADLPTDERLKRVAREADPQLAALYFQFGRYLLISSSRPGSQAANLQGIWNDQLNPPWDSKYTDNINTEMNYWPAESTGLAECHEPLFSLIEDCSVTGQSTAKEHYAARGWVLHHNTDLWRGTAPINASNHGIWPTGGAWLTQHMWEHYLFTGDEDFLRDRAYPVLRSASQFFVDYLVEDPDTGLLVSGPSNSPEQGGLVMGPTMDHQIIRELFANTAQAAELLGEDSEFAAQLRELHGRIAPNQIGKHGQLQEWLEDKDDPRNEHRHVSHLWGVYPGSEITPRETPELFAAAKQSLIFRGDGGTGWSKAWKICLWARFLDGDHSHKMLVEALAGNTYPNLLDAHPPFQIDGNFGGTAGVVEMLLQSQNDELELLPALPSAWPTGRVTGLRARGGFTVDMEWKDGQLAVAEITSLLGKPLMLRLGDQTIQVPTKAGETFRFDGQLTQSN